LAVEHGELGSLENPRPAVLLRRLEQPFHLGVVEVGEAAYVRVLVAGSVRLARFDTDPLLEAQLSIIH
jgi:hypothetical protein